MILRELSDTELDAVSGGAVAVGASSSGDRAFAVAATFVGGGLAVAVVGGALVNFTPILHLFSKLVRHRF
jgi:bacteriocin-like protein